MYFGIDKAGKYAVNKFSIILSHKNNSTTASSCFYFYTVLIKIPNEKLYELALWCDENCIGKWLVGIHRSAFKNEQDAMAFKLMWI